MKQPTALTVLLTLSMVATAQQAEPGDNLGPGEVAMVNGQRIPESVYRLYTISNFQVNPDNIAPEARTQLVNQLIGTMLLAQEAERRGLDRERRVAAELELNRLQLLASFMSERYASENPPTQQELQAAYENVLEQFESRTEYKVRHIVSGNGSA